MLSPRVGCMSEGDGAVERTVEEKLALARKNIADTEQMISEMEALLFKLDEKWLNSVSIGDLLVLMREAHLRYEGDRDLCISILYGGFRKSSER